MLRPGLQRNRPPRPGRGTNPNLVVGCRSCVSLADISSHLQTHGQEMRWRSVMNLSEALLRGNEGHGEDVEAEE